MLNNIIGVSSYQFHIEETKLVINGVQLVHNSLHNFVFLSGGVNTVQRKRSKITNIDDKLSDDVLVRQILIIQINMSFDRVSSRTDQGVQDVLPI